MKEIDRDTFQVKAIAILKHFGVVTNLYTITGQIYDELVNPKPKSVKSEGLNPKGPSYL